MPGPAYDELRFGVVLVPPPDAARPALTIVDPATLGRYQGPFGNGDQDVVIYLNDEVADQIVNCASTAFSQGTMVATGAAQVLVESQRIVDVDVPLVPPVMPAPADTDPSAAASPSPSGNE